MTDRRGAFFTAVATCLEGALKIKEVSYMHSEGVSSRRCDLAILPC